MPLLTKLKVTGKIEGLYLRPPREGGFEKAPTGAIRPGFGDVKIGDAVALFIPPQRNYAHGT